MPQILLTGASGRLGTHLRAWFGKTGRTVLATDISPPGDAGPVEIADLADRAAVDRLMAEDISAVVHFGGMAKEAGWQTILDANIVGTYNVFEAARKAGIKRVIYASSYHVLGMHPTGDVPLGPDATLRPDSLYGVSKVFGETLGRLYFDKFGIECLAIRICTAGNPGTPREARLWCNRDDLARLVERGLDIETLATETCSGFRRTRTPSSSILPMTTWAGSRNMPRGRSRRWPTKRSIPVIRATGCWAGHSLNDRTRMTRANSPHASN